MYKPGLLFTLQSALINRVLTFLLIKAKVITTVAGDFVKTESTGIKRFKVEYNPASLNSRRYLPKDYNVVITRFGRDHEHIKKALPNLEEDATTPLTGRVAELGIASELDNDTRRWFWEKIKNCNFMNKLSAS